MTTYRRAGGLFGLLALSTGLAGTAGADGVERYVSLEVHNPNAFVMALDDFWGGGSLDGATGSLWAATFDGTSPTSHVLTLSYDDYAEMQAIDDRVRGSREWVDYLNAIEGTNDVTALTMGVERVARGSGWHNHGAAMVFNMTVSDPGAYAAAFTELVDSMDNPGSVRLIEMRAGGMGATHLAIITAADFTSLNTYLDELFGSDEYASFADDVGDIRRINTTSIFRRLQTWGD